MDASPLSPNSASILIVNPYLYYHSLAPEGSVVAIVTSVHCFDGHLLGIMFPLNINIKRHLGKLLDVCGHVAFPFLLLGIFRALQTF